jgi:hypothetical protein
MQARGEDKSDWTGAAARLGCFVGTFSPSRRQIRSTRLNFTIQPAFRNSAVMQRYP